MSKRSSTQQMQQQQATLMDPIFTSPGTLVHANVTVADFEGYIQFKILDNIAYPGIP